MEFGLKLAEKATSLAVSSPRLLRDLVSLLKKITS